MAENCTKPLKIVMYPWFAMGHFIPYIGIANKLAKRGHKIILVVPHNAGTKLGPMNLHPGLIEFRPITIPIVDGLPPDVETSNDITIQEQPLLRHALDLTEPEFRSLLSELQPDVVFFDLMHWIPRLAREMGIKSVHYSVVGPAAVGSMFVAGTTVEDLMRYPTGFPEEMRRRRHKQSARGLHWIQNHKEQGSGITLYQRFMIAFSECDAIGFKTCREIEGKYGEFLEKKLNLPALLSGPAIPNIEAGDERWAKWLDKFQPNTVVFCAFGSEAVITKEEFQQLLLGIELTNLPFLIALRPPRGVATINEALPLGFTDRTGARGVVHGGWVPQQQILHHSSVGCFVTHCGAGSMWEGLMSDCQLVALPHAADQYVNARLLSEDLRVAVEVEKGEEDGKVTKEAVQAAVTAATAEESDIGREIKRNHDKLKKVLMQEGMEDDYIDGFIRKLQNL